MKETEQLTNALQGLTIFLVGCTGLIFGLLLIGLGLAMFLAS